MTAAESAQLLTQLTAQLTLRDKRWTERLRDPLEDYTRHWFMCVPRCFNDALDIRETERVAGSVWTQGADFSFSQGDTLYDSPHAYGVWSDALKHINVCVQVVEGVSASISADGIRFPGSVTVSVLTPNPARSGVLERGRIAMSQDEFVRFLIAGPEGELKRMLEAVR